MGPPMQDYRSPTGELGKAVMFDGRMPCQRCGYNLSIDDRQRQVCSRCGVTFDLLELEARYRPLEWKDDAARSMQVAERLGGIIGAGTLVCGFGLAILGGGLPFLLSEFGVSAVRASGLVFYWRWDFDAPWHHAFLVVGGIWLAIGLAVYRFAP